MSRVECVLVTPKIIWELLFRTLGVPKQTLISKRGQTKLVSGCLYLYVSTAILVFGAEKFLGSWAGKNPSVVGIFGFIR